MKTKSRRLFLTVLAFVVTGGLAAAQAPQVNGFFSSLAIDAPASAQVGVVPTAVNAMTDSPVSVNLLAQSNTPVVLLYSIGGAAGSTIDIASFDDFGVQLDLADVGSAGFSDQVIVDGYARPFPNTFTDSTGVWDATFRIPACPFVNGAVSCITVPTFEVSVQALVQDPTSSPFNISSTGAGVVSFVNCYTEFPFGPFTTTPADNKFLYNFPSGFTFSFYGNSYSSVWVSENGYIQFGTDAGMSTFSVATMSYINNGNPKIMSFFTDMVFSPQPALTPRIYAQCVVENSIRKIKFVHEFLEQIGGPTGTHGGQITITELGEIAVYVAGYNSFSAYGTGVGIVAGPHPIAQLTTAYGRDLSADVGFATVLGAGVPGFEYFDHGTTPTPNPIDLIGIEQFNTHGVGPGITYIPDPAVLPYTLGYVIL
ncbi:MAG: hypothetical protein V3W41_14155 [Planctomycetota bacterium]